METMQCRKSQSFRKSIDSNCKISRHQRISASDPDYRHTEKKVFFGILPERVVELMRDFQRDDALIRYRASPFL